MIKTFEAFTKDRHLLHVTTPEKADDIQKNGFKPEPFLDFVYYSAMGKDGIYFYDNPRWAQTYAYHLLGKLKQKKVNLDKVALLHVTVPASFVHDNGKGEDGFFVKRKDLSAIKVDRKEILEPDKIY